MDAPHTVRLSEENAEYFGERVGEGMNDTLDEAVDAALTRMREDEIAEIRRGIEESIAHPERLVPADEVFARIKEKLERMQSAGEGVKAAE